MRKFLCKVFSFLLNLVSQLVELVAQTLIKIGTAAVEVLSEVAGAVGGAFIKNPIVLGALVFGAYLLFKPTNDDDAKSKTKVKPEELGGMISEFRT